MNTQNPSVSKSNRLPHVAIFRFFFTNLRNIPRVPIKHSVMFLKPWTITSYFPPQTQPLHLYLAVGSHIATWQEYNCSACKWILVKFSGNLPAPPQQLAKKEWCTKAHAPKVLLKCAPWKCLFFFLLEGFMKASSQAGFSFKLKTSWTCWPFPLATLHWPGQPQAARWQDHGSRCTQSIFSGMALTTYDAPPTLVVVITNVIHDGVGPGSTQWSLSSTWVRIHGSTRFPLNPRTAVVSSNLLPWPNSKQVGGWVENHRPPLCKVLDSDHCGKCSWDVMALCSEVSR